MRAALCGVFAAVVLALAPPATAQDPHNSFNQLSLGNGYGFALYDGDARKVDLFTEHPYRAHDPSTVTRNLAYDTYFGARAESEAHWLADLPLTALEYTDQAGLAHATQGFGPLSVETYAFAPFGLNAPAIVLALHVTNVSNVVQHNAAAYAILNFHLGSGVQQTSASGAPLPNADGEHAVWDGTHQVITETGPSGLTMRYYALGASTHHATGSPSGTGVYAIGNEGGDLGDDTDSGVGTDVVPGLEWVLPDLAPGASAWVGVVETLADDASAQSFIAGRTADVILQAERDAWTAWRTLPPVGLSPTETRVWRQSEAVLRMAQCREPGMGNGALVAAMPPGVWWISWVRDMAYATVALARMGHHAEASAAIDFWSGATVGAYEAMYVHTPYHVSVVRYFGGGTEESDSNANGPNIEYDGFGLATWAAHAAGSTAMDANATTLQNLTASNGMIDADSSIWEVHWNGQQKQFAYTSIAAARGLCEAGDTTAARAVRDALLAHAVLPGGGLGQSVEAVAAAGPGGAGAIDAAAVEAINFGLIAPQSAVATQTLASFAALHTPVGRGYFRNQDGGGYDSQEWVFVDLRIADALRRVGRTADADALLAWVTLQADANHGLQAELYDRTNADYVGSIPMVGFGAGVYLLALLDRASPDVAAAGCFGTAGAHRSARTNTDVPGDAGGVGCSARPGGTDAPAWALSFLVMAGMGLRRKRRASLAAMGCLTVLAGCGSTPTGGSPDGAVADGVGTDSRGTDAVGTDGSGTDGGLADGGGDAAMDAGLTTLGGAIPVRSCVTSFAYPLGHAAAAVSVAGGWNSFSATANPLEDVLGTGVYRGAVEIPTGDYGYKFVADGVWSEDPGQPLVTYINNVENSRMLVPDCHVPELTVLSATATADGTVDLSVQYTDGADVSGPDPTSFAVTVYPGTIPAGAVSFDARTGVGTVHITGLAQTKYTYHFNVRSHAGAAATELVVPMWVEQEPYEWGDGSLYFAFTDRFRDGNTLNDGRIGGIDPRVDYYGGDYAGILAALQEGYFDQLGVRAIWISPPNQNTHSPGLGADGVHYFSAYHGYWPTEPRAVEPHWGTMDDLRALTAEAHRHGIRVLMDLVNNQLHIEHVYYVAHAHDGWFNTMADGGCICGTSGCDWNTYILTCWFTPYLADVNWTHMDTVDQMIDDSMWWLIQADFDGFRVDAVKMMQDIAQSTLRYRLSQLEHGNTRYYTVGETYVGADQRSYVAHYVTPRMLDGQFDFPLYWQVRTTFSSNSGTMADLEAAVTASESAYGSGIMSPFLGNQDVDRFLTDTAGNLTGNPQTDLWDAPPAAPDADAPYNRLKLAFTFLLTQRGLPLIYYGDEIGMPGAADPDNRRPMRFGTDLSTREAGVLAHVRTVGHLRATLPGLRRGARRALYTDGDGYVYARGTSSEIAIVALNRGSTARSVSVSLPPDLGIPDGTVLRDALGTSTVTVTGGTVSIPFAPVSSSIYIW